MKNVCCDAVQEAMLNLEGCASASWSSPLVDALESLRVGSALQWCIDSAFAVLGSEVAAETITTLRRLKSESIPAVELVQIGRDLWYSRPERTAAETVAAKIYEAAAALESGDFQKYKRGVALLVSEVLASGATSISDPTIRKAIELFSDRCGTLNSASENCDDND